MFEELGRYSFARRAEDAKRAIGLFTLLVVVVETVTYWRPRLTPAVNLALRAPSVIVHVAAGMALWWALRHRSRLVLVMAAVAVLHAAFDVGSVEITKSWNLG